MKLWPMFICLLLLAPKAHAEKLTVALSADEVAIDSNFTGTDLTVFGAIDRAASETQAASYDVIIMARGPSGKVTVDKKEAAGPFWLNREQHKFRSVPGFLSLLSTRPVAAIADETTQTNLAIGIPAQFKKYEDAPARPDFMQALIRLRREAGLFDDTRVVRFLSPTLFRATIHLPGGAPLGAYDVEVLAFADQKNVAAVETGFWVRRTGMEHELAEAARSHGVIYGLAVVAMALAFGWFASVIFRRD